MSLKNLIRSEFAISVSFVIIGCANTIPVAVIGQHGEIMRGTNTFSLTSATFSVTDGKVTCSGSYNPLNESRTITTTVNCTDARTGIVTATRDSPTSGGGVVTLSDGTSRRFIFGDAASRI
jgi:hypothetical protein